MIICEICGVTKHYPPRAIKKGARYCSRACLGKAKTLKGRMVIKCLFCNKERSIKKCDMQRGWGKYCNKKCFGLAHREENHIRWKGTQNQDRLERARFGQSIRTKVLKRDDYTCQLCGIRGKNMQVDHIQSWIDYIELRFSMDNCRTLCKPCHYQITFGKPMPKSVKAWGDNLYKGGPNNFN